MPFKVFLAKMNFIWLADKGPLAHLVERFHGMEEVTGSIPVRSTLLNENVVSIWQAEKEACVSG